MKKIPIIHKFKWVGKRKKRRRTGKTIGYWGVWEGDE